MVNIENNFYEMTCVYQFLNDKTELNEAEFKEFLNKDIEEKEYFVKLSDEELFKRCGGRTAHK